MNQLKQTNSEVEQLQMLASFRRIFEANPDGVLCVDLERRIILVNFTAELLFGYREEELLGSTSDCLYSNREDFLRVGERLRSDAELLRKPFEVTLRKKNGTAFPAEIVVNAVKGAQGEMLCFLALIRDISERKELMGNLQQLEVKFRTVADFTYDWECWLQSDGRFRYVSPSCQRLTGYPAENFMNNPSLFRDIIHPDDKPIWDEHHLESRAEAALREVHFRIIRADGEVRWIEHACQPVTDESGNLQGFRSSNRDITRRKNYEQDLHHALSEIKQYKEQLEAESEYLREEMKQTLDNDTIIGSSNTLEYVFFRIEQVSDSNTTVLLLGETGTGKELFARAIHTASARKDRPLVKIDCAVLPEYLIESELFGHEKGAFTGAESKRIGRFELADKGTIFLDEIGELPLDLQPKLLRILQDGEFVRVGGSMSRRVDVRVIAATNRDLYQDVMSGRFRKDLWYRLNVFPITAPPLRDRKEDIPQLVRYFLDRHSCRQRKNITIIPADVMMRLGNYHWPGNVRELENVIERAVFNTSGSTLTLADELQPPPGMTDRHLLTLEEMECRYITEVLEQANWKVSGKGSAAEILGLKRSTLRARIKKHNIRIP